MTILLLLLAGLVGCLHAYVWWAIAWLLCAGALLTMMDEAPTIDDGEVV